MFLYLSKLLPPLLFPPGLPILMLLAALVLWKRRRGLSAALVTIAMVSLYGFSTDLIADALDGSLESRYASVDVDTLPKADAIVVLGGYLHPAGGARRYSEFNEGADRLWMAAMLYKAGKAPVVLLSGGNIDFLGRGAIPEAIAAQQILRQWGVPAEAILVEPRSQNTHENAAFSKPILEAKGARQLLLVTSAFHMPRAMAIFRHEGMQPMAVPTDYLTGWGERVPIFALLPDADALARSKAALREWIGLIVYKLRGWA